MNGRSIGIGDRRVSGTSQPPVWSTTAHRWLAPNGISRMPCSACRDTVFRLYDGRRRPSYGSATSHFEHKRPDFPFGASAISLGSRPKSRSASSNNGRKDAFFDQGNSNCHSIAKIALSSHLRAPLYYGLSKLAGRSFLRGGNRTGLGDLRSAVSAGSETRAEQWGQRPAPNSFVTALEGNRRWNHQLVTNPRVLVVCALILNRPVCG